MITFNPWSVSVTWTWSYVWILSVSCKPCSRPAQRSQTGWHLTYYIMGYHIGNRQCHLVESLLWGFHLSLYWNQCTVPCQFAHPLRHLHRDGHPNHSWNEQFYMVRKTPTTYSLHSWENGSTKEAMDSYMIDLSKLKFALWQVDIRGPWLESWGRGGVF